MPGLSEIASSMSERLTLDQVSREDDYEDNWGIREDSPKPEWISPWGDDEDPTHASDLSIPEKPCMRPSLGGIVHPMDRDISEDRGPTIYNPPNGGLHAKRASIRTINALCVPPTENNPTGRVELSLDQMLITNLTGRPISEAFRNFPELPKDNDDNEGQSGNDNASSSFIASVPPEKGPQRPIQLPMKAPTATRSGPLLPDPPPVERDQPFVYRGHVVEVPAGTIAPRPIEASRRVFQQTPEPQGTPTMLETYLDLPRSPVQVARPKPILQMSEVVHSVEDYAPPPPPTPVPSSVRPESSMRVISPTIAQAVPIPPAPKPILPPLQPTRQVYLPPSSAGASSSSSPQLPLPASPSTHITKNPGQEARNLAPDRTQGTNRTKRQAQKSPRKEAFAAHKQKGESRKQRSPDDLFTPNGSENSAESSANAKASSSRADSESSDDPKKKRHICPIEGCGKSFTRRNDVNRHLKSSAAHRDLNGVPEESASRCQYCKRILSRGDAARRHEIESACGKRTLPSERDKLSARPQQTDSSTSAQK